MANVLPLEKQIAVVSALAEGNAIRAIERMTGIHRDTIMRLGVKIGEGCERVLDEQMKELNSRVIQMDEIWGFVGKKNKNASAAERRAGLGDVWTFVAIDAESKMVPAFLCGKRDRYTAISFVEDLSNRLTRRPQISSDAYDGYAEAVERGFGSEADYGQIVKVYGKSETDEKRYSPARLQSVRRLVMSGTPDDTLISTSYIERQNLTMRMHMRRLTRLTNAFSKKLTNFKAAAALYFAYYNFVRIHKSLRMTPAMARGVTDHVWTVEELIGKALEA